MFLYGYACCIADDVLQLSEGLPVSVSIVMPSKDQPSSPAPVSSHGRLSSSLGDLQGDQGDACSYNDSGSHGQGSVFDDAWASFQSFQGEAIMAEVLQADLDVHGQGAPDTPDSASHASKELHSLVISNRKPASYTVQCSDAFACRTPSVSLPYGYGAITDLWPNTHVSSLTCRCYNASTPLQIVLKICFSHCFQNIDIALIRAYFAGESHDHLEGQPSRASQPSAQVADNVSPGTAAEVAESSLAEANVDLYGADYAAHLYGVQ